MATKTKDMTTGNPMRLLLQFTLPVLAGNVFQQFYSMVDTIIVGKYIGSDSLAAVGTTGPMNFLVLGFAFGISSGFAVMPSQRFGAKDEKGLRVSVAHAITLGIFFTILLTALAVLTTRPMLKLINTPDNIIDDAYIYIVTIYWGIAATMLYNMVSCMLRALGDSKTPLYFLILSSVINIGLDLLFIISFKMGVFGAALATVVAQGISGILSLLYTYKKFEILHLHKEDFKLDWQNVYHHLVIALPMAFQFSVTAIGTIILQGALNLFGSQTIAAYTAATKVEQIITQTGPSLGVAAASYTGQNLGAGRYDRIRQGAKSSTIIAVVSGVVTTALIWLFGRNVCGLFVSASETVIIDTAMIYLELCALFVPILFLLFVYRNVLQGMGRSFMPFMAGVFELAARTVVAFTLPGIIGFKGICFAGPIAWIVAAVPLMIAYILIMRKFYNDKEKAGA